MAAGKEHKAAQTWAEALKDTNTDAGWYVIETSGSEPTVFEGPFHSPEECEQAAKAPTEAKPGDIEHYKAQNPGTFFA
jgi:hypothetical protein